MCCRHESQKSKVNRRRGPDLAASRLQSSTISTPARPMIEFICDPRPTRYLKAGGQQRAQRTISLIER